jgi:Caspase domain
MKKLSCLPRQLLITAFCATGLLTFSATAQAPNDVRIALIIGNSAYPGNMALANPSNDAKDMAEMLRSMGFGVVEIIDGNRMQMLNAIARAGQALSSRQGVGMLFYAGHGLQLDWHNFMIPVDAKLASTGDVTKQTVDIDTVMNTFKAAGTRMNIVVLDACRDNPFADGKTASGKGLAPLDAPTGTFLAYATAPGNVAQDGTGKNGLYTGFLLQELQKPSVRIEDIFKRVRFSVRKASDGAQIPWETTSLEDDFVFNSGIKKIVKLTDDQKEKAFEIEKAEWDKIKDSKSADPFYAYVQKYPNGLLSGSAQAAIDRISQNKIEAYRDKLGVIQGQTSGRFKAGDSIQYVRTDGFTKTQTQKTIRIASVAAGLAATDAGVYATLQGEWVSTDDGRNTFDPPRRYLPLDRFAIGQKWEGRSEYVDTGNVSNIMKDEAEIVAYESVTTKAGTFMAYKIIMTSSTMVLIPNQGMRRSATIHRTYWIIPDYGLPIKTIYSLRTGTPYVRDEWSEEAVSLTRGAS